MSMHPTTLLVFLFSHFIVFVLAMLVTTAYLHDTDKNTENVGQQSGPVSVELLQSTLADTQLELKWKQEEIRDAYARMEVLEDKLRSLRDLQEAQQETQVRPDFDPTLGGVPFPGSPGFRPGLQEPAGQEPAGSLPTTGDLQPGDGE